MENISFAVALTKSYQEKIPDSRVNTTCFAVGLYFAVKGLNFFRYFAGKGAKISKFRENFEISLKFRNFLRVHMASSEQGGATQS